MEVLEIHSTDSLKKCRSAIFNLSIRYVHILYSYFMAVTVYEGFRDRARIRKTYTLHQKTYTPTLTPLKKQKQKSAFSFFFSLMIFF